MRILLVEDQAMVRGALRALLNMEDDIEVVAECEDGEKALACLAHTSIDLVLSDIEMPNMSGVELFEHLAEHQPQIKKVVVTTFGKAGYIQRCMRAGVDAFLLKDAPSEALGRALRQVAAGKRVIDPELAIFALDNHDPLSEKERSALRLAAEGKKTQEIAASLCLSEGTVRNYLSEAIAKLHASNRIDAARIAKQKGWL